VQCCDFGISNETAFGKRTVRVLMFDCDSDSEGRGDVTGCSITGGEEHPDIVLEEVLGKLNRTGIEIG
jgi:hypothetical protein